LPALVIQLKEGKKQLPEKACRKKVFPGRPFLSLYVPFFHPACGACPHLRSWLKQKEKEQRPGKVL
jgi:hypothetical protein